MTVGIIVFIVIYCLVLCTYFYTETSGKMYLRAPNKIILALMFFVFACVIFSLNEPFKDGLTSYKIMLMAGLFLAMLGDIFLLFDLNRGGDFFLAGNVCFSIYYICLLNSEHKSFKQYWWIIFIVLGMLAIVYAISALFPKFLNFKCLNKYQREVDMKFPMLFYLSSITLHGTLGVVTLAFFPDKYLLLGLGSILFMISDYVLTTDKFIFKEKNKWCLRLNSATYFTGLLLIVLWMALQF